MKAMYRIIDANFNRAREGLRMAEDYCRFALNNETLSSQCKQIRHQLSSIITRLDPQKLITSRDAENDVGYNLKIASQMKRKNLEDCVKASFARTIEALRVLTETAFLINPAIAHLLEKIRYNCYSLEKDVAIYTHCTLRFEKVRLYVIINADSQYDALKLTRIVAQNGADCIQLRAKTITDAAFLGLAKRFVEICKLNNVLSIINDRTDIAVAAEADGIHLGRTDLPISAAKKCQLTPLIIGTSTHSLTELKPAIKHQPCYVALGAVFPTTTKQEVKVAGLKYLTRAMRLLKDKPVIPVAVGGINLENIDKVLQTGVKKIAVSSCICNSENPAQYCKKLKQKISKQL